MTNKEKKVQVALGILHKVVGPDGKERSVKYVKKLTEHVEVYIIGQRREWKYFWPLDEFINANPEFDNYTDVI